MEPSLHSGINAAVLLVAAGQRFEDSDELRLIGEPQACTPVQRENTGLEPGLSSSPSGSSLPESTPGPSSLSWALMSPYSHDSLFLSSHLRSFHMHLFPNPHLCLSPSSHLRFCHTDVFTPICALAHMNVVAHTWALPTMATTLTGAHAPPSQA